MGFLQKCLLCHSKDVVRAYRQVLPGGQTPIELMVPHSKAQRGLLCFFYIRSIDSEFSKKITCEDKLLDFGSILALAFPQV